jgi:hypothetical protein
MQLANPISLSSLAPSTCSLTESLVVESFSHHPAFRSGKRTLSSALGDARAKSTAIKRRDIATVLIVASTAPTFGHTVT